MSIKLISLPAEILESIIVTLNDAPLSILALSKTCTTFFILLYKAPDHHVWRTLFLSRYDDPRQTDHLNLHPFNKSLWRDEYLARAVAEERIPHGTTR
ncbi:hypothetical protein QCA50_014329 [Cerrena zonata]|uniref:F-box domain-containing protein n=1 Tax=Cerrena zonata TaxID=2478898 RepID=A0AAW0FSK7_9APHY